MDLLCFFCLVFAFGGNQDIKRRLSKDKDSTVNKTVNRGKRNPTGKPLVGPTNSQSIRPLPSLFNR